MTPTVEEITEGIAARGLDPQWFDDGAPFSIFRPSAGELWLRFVDSGRCVKITVEEKDYGDWPALPT